MKTTIAAVLAVCAVLGLGACDTESDAYGACIEHDIRVDDSRCDGDLGVMPAPSGPHWVWTDDASRIPAIGKSGVGLTRNVESGVTLWVGAPASGDASARGTFWHHPVGYVIRAPKSS